MPIQSKLQTFFGNFPSRIYKKGEVLIQAGDKPAAFYLVSGMVVQYDIAKNGSKLSLNTYKPGTFIPLSSILNDAPSKFFFESTQNTTVHVAPASDVVGFLKENPDVTFDALSRIARGGEGLMLRLSKAMEGNAEERILQELLIMKSRFFDGKDTVKVTDTELAAKTGMARETISRTLKKLDAQGIIRTDRGKVTILKFYHI